MLDFILAPPLRIALLCISGVLILLSYALSVFCDKRGVCYVIVPSVFLHLFLIFLLFTLGATVDIVLAVFLGLLFLYTLMYALHHHLTSLTEAREDMHPDDEMEGRGEL